MFKINLCVVVLIQIQIDLHLQDCNNRDIARLQMPYGKTTYII